MTGSRLHKLPTSMRDLMFSSVVVVVEFVSGRRLYGMVTARLDVPWHVVNITTARGKTQRFFRDDGSEVMLPGRGMEYRVIGTFLSPFGEPVTAAENP